MRTVCIESPYAGPADDPTADLIREGNVRYLGQALRDSLHRGEAPFASHGLYPAVLDDDDTAERAHGIRAGLALAAKLDLSAVYIERGISSGMVQGIQAAVRAGRPVELRVVGGASVVDWAALIPAGSLWPDGPDRVADVVALEVKLRAEWPKAGGPVDELVPQLGLVLAAFGRAGRLTDEHKRALLDSARVPVGFGVPR